MTLTKQDKEVLINLLQSAVASIEEINPTNPPNLYLETQKKAYSKPYKQIIKKLQEELKEQ